MKKSEARSSENRKRPSQKEGACRRDESAATAIAAPQKAKGKVKVRVSGIDVEWDVPHGTCTFENLPVAMMWIDSTLAHLMAGVQAMVGTERFSLALQAQGRDSVETDWKIISRFSDFKRGFEAIAAIAAVAGWGDWRLLSLDEKKKTCRFRIYKSWEGCYQLALKTCWGSAMLAGKLSGYCSKLFNENYWAQQTAFICKGDPYDEFTVSPSMRSVEDEIEKLLQTDAATRADMAVALHALHSEVARRTRTEDALRKSEERFRSLVETTSDLIWEVDANARYTYVSPMIKKILGYEPSEFLGKTPFDFMPADEAVRIGSLFWKIAKVAEPFWDMENAALHKDGHTVILESSGVPVFDNEGKFAGYRGVDRDITGRKKIEEKDRELIRARAGAEMARSKSAELEQAYNELKNMHDKLIRSERLAMLGKVAGTLAHELRSPLGSIQNASYLLSRKLAQVTDEKVKKTLQILEKEVKASDMIINDVLTFGREQKPVLAVHDINRLIRQALHKVSVPATIEVVLRLDPGVSGVFVSEAQIEHVLINVLMNAVQAMPRGGKLTVASSMRSSGAVTVEVGDTGVGIPEELLDKIFEPLFSTKDKGIGLGLAICRTLLSANKGSIEARSRLHEGSVFTIQLPAAKSGR